MQASIGELVSNVAAGPITMVLAAMGALLIGVSMAVFGYLSLGAAVDLVTPH